MGFLDKLFHSEDEVPSPAYHRHFGRYSDNNKTKAQLDAWKKAAKLYKEKKYHQAAEQFFLYVRDSYTNNLEFARSEDGIDFSFIQGSNRIRGKINKERIFITSDLAKMTQTSIPVMRKLLEQNYFLHYSKYVLKGDRIQLNMYTDLTSADPNKLYYAMKELAVRADKVDDLLVNDFEPIKEASNEHIVHASPEVVTVKYKYFKKWLKETVALMDDLNSDTLAGAITYSILAFIFRTDYLIMPEGKLTADLEKINSYFWLNAEKTQAAERNATMRSMLIKVDKEWDQERFAQHIYSSKHTFSITQPQPYKTVVETIGEALKNIVWYRENNHEDIANVIMEYALSYTQFSFSVPKAVTDLFDVFMHVNHSKYYKELGVQQEYYNPAEKSFDREEIQKSIDKIVEDSKERYPKLKFDFAKMKFDNLLDFNTMFLIELTKLDFSKK